MICCLPFTYYPLPYLHVLEKLGPPLVLICPGRRFACEQMQAGLAQGLVDIRTPAGIDEAYLDQILAEYRAWADLHQRDLDALAGFLNAERQPFPLVDETDPTQIRTQVNRFGQAEQDSAHQRLMQAAVFMAMAHEFDHHQDALSHDFAAIGKIEQQMFQGLAGDATELQPFQTSGGGREKVKLVDPGLYLTEKRIQAWATLAGSTTPDCFMYLTTSKVVFDSLCDAFPQAERLVEWILHPPAPAGDAPLLSEQQLTHLKRLAQAETFADVAAINAEKTTDQNPWPRLAVYGVENCSPKAVPGRLAGAFNSPEDASADRTCGNTLIGYLEVIG